MWNLSHLVMSLDLHQVKCTLYFTETTQVPERKNCVCGATVVCKALRFHIYVYLYYHAKLFHLWNFIFLSIPNSAVFQLCSHLPFSLSLVKNDGLWVECFPDFFFFKFTVSVAQFNGYIAGKRRNFQIFVQFTSVICNSS
jgi:hypothetical protein